MDEKKLNNGRGGGGGFGFLFCSNSTNMLESYALVGRLCVFVNPLVNVITRKIGLVEIGLGSLAEHLCFDNGSGVCVVLGDRGLEAKVAEGCGGKGWNWG